jgi:hypothetical protein
MLGSMAEKGISSCSPFVSEYIDAFDDLAVNQRSASRDQRFRFDGCDRYKRSLCQGRSASRNRLG